MANYKKYVMANSLEEAYTLNQKRTNFIVSGNGWLKMCNNPKDTLIDLSNLGLNQIEVLDDCFKIGAMVSLRELELNKELNEYTNGAFNDALKAIVGVQFRSSATIGGSVWGRFGFSDPLTLLLSLNTSVILYKKGEVTLKDFIDMPYDNDILLYVVIKKENIKVAYESFRNQATDFPVLTTAISKVENEYRISIGARPMKANLVTISDVSSLDKIAKMFRYESNMRASKEYRLELAKVLVKRCLEKVGE